MNDTKTARELRHQIQQQAAKVAILLAGRQMDKEHQVRRVAKVAREIGVMLTLTNELATLVNERDFDAHQAEKQAEKEKIEAEFSAMVSAFVNDEDEDDDQSPLL